jgi:hypothetical protein
MGDVGHALEKREIHTELWLENLKIEGDYEDLIQLGE